MSKATISDIDFSLWQKQLAPLLYDSFSHHNLSWPTQACRWGSIIEEFSYKVRCRAYFSEQTDNSEPQKLISANVDVCKPHVCSSEVVSNWNEFSRCPYIKDQKVVFHPGEVNKIREIPQHPGLVVTHTDSPELFLWNMDKQPSRTREKGSSKLPPNSVADLKLTGHEEDALFPLATSRVAPFVASGGNDKLVLLWSVQDHMETVLSSGPTTGGKEPELAARTKLKGHKDTVEDVVFKPDSTEQLCSVGDDHMVMFWDTRSGTAPVSSIELAHGKGQDIQCVDWDSTTGHLVATGAQDGSLRIWDARKVATSKECVACFRVHTGGVIRLEWHPTQPGVLASGGEDRLMMIWKMNPDGPFTNQSAEPATKKGAKPASTPGPPELIFQHAGHRKGKVVDFQWSRSELLPWTMLSVSDDTVEEETGGGSLQIWRMNDLIYRDEDEVVAELEKHREFIINGRNPPAVTTTKKADTSAGPSGTATQAVAKAANPAPAPAEVPKDTATAAKDAAPKDTAAAEGAPQDAAAPAVAPKDAAPAAEQAEKPAAAEAEPSSAPQAMEEDAPAPAPAEGDASATVEVDAPTVAVVVIAVVVWLPGWVSKRKNQNLEVI
eukprot:gene30922-35977_t